MPHGLRGRVRRRSLVLLIVLHIYHALLYSSGGFCQRTYLTKKKSENYVILLTNVTTINLIKKKKGKPRPYRLRGAEHWDLGGTAEGGAHCHREVPQGGVHRRSGIRRPGWIALLLDMWVPRLLLACVAGSTPRGVCSNQRV